MIPMGHPVIYTSLTDATQARVLSRLFRRLFLEGLMDLHHEGQLAFFGDLEQLGQAAAQAA